METSGKYWVVSPNVTRPSHNSYTFWQCKIIVPMHQFFPQASLLNINSAVVR